jgi:DNA modification methylase
VSNQDLPKPYYQDDLVTIYHGDCRDLLPLIKADVIVTDPPYGIGGWSSTGGNSLRPDEVAALNGWDVAPDPQVLRLVVATAELAIIWGGNYLCDALGPFRAPLVWDKGIRGMHFADGEMAWTNLTGTLRILNLPIASTEVKGHRFHPTQKPIGVMAWSIQQSRTEGTILDPFMGSGSTLVAAKSLNRHAIGIEIEERYCEIAAQRCSQGVLGLEALP